MYAAEGVQKAELGLPGHDAVFFSFRSYCTLPTYTKRANTEIVNEIVNGVVRTPVIRPTGERTMVLKESVPFRGDGCCA